MQRHHASRPSRRTLDRRRTRPQHGRECGNHQTLHGNLHFPLPKMCQRNRRGGSAVTCKKCGQHQNSGPANKRIIKKIMPTSRCKDDHSNDPRSLIAPIQAKAYELLHTARIIRRPRNQSQTSPTSAHRQRPSSCAIKYRDELAPLHGSVTGFRANRVRGNLGRAGGGASAMPQPASLQSRAQQRLPCSG